MERKFTDQELVRRQHLQELQQDGRNPYETEIVERTCTLNEFVKEYEGFEKESLHNRDEFRTYTLAGRVMITRQTFGVLKDFSGTCQFYVSKKEVPESVFKKFKEIDLGDIVKVIGKPMKTMTGEVTLYVLDIDIVSKALKVLPEKYHGLVDEEARARNRYVDLIVNDDSMNTFVNRSIIVKSIRNYMDGNGFFEVETPVLNPTLGGAAARPFITHHNALDREYYLRIATELPLKKCIVGGFEKVYEIGRIFRNEGMDATHNPEFTSMEAYVAYTGMEGMMDLTEGVIKNAAKAMNKSVCQYRGFEIDISKPFKRVHMVDLINEYTGVNFYNVKSDEEAVAIAKEHNIELEKHQMKYGHVINAFFETYCEEKLIEPTFVFGHPIEISPLAKKDYSDQRFTKRFELFIGQKEFANAFAELNDPIDQYERFEAQLKEKELGNDEANDMDMDFVNALEYGLPPTGGMGIGIDRLVMLLTEKDTIRDVLLFPHMKDK
ncbi:lysine--tRNA ligase [Ureaplasma ceti]|uniref:Lysine--tRNA ligase n=1 Tax=Ureaplasma ceti TaxID=3119530 RepID=A0ABP9UBX3_9BACT